MTGVRESYNEWAGQYDTNINRTRDLEARAIRTVLALHNFETCLEIGCGTGKNTEWLVAKATSVTSVDLSEAMLAKAKAKITGNRVEFIQADILQPWNFAKGAYDLITFSLVLEHVQDLGPVFKNAAAHLKPSGLVYIGELHPFRQYSGSQAKFETTSGEHLVTCFRHHVSDFAEAAAENGLRLKSLTEYFDDDDRSGTPRILALLFSKHNQDFL